jgi:thioesterase domain-containing protein
MQHRTSFALAHYLQHPASATAEETSTVIPVQPGNADRLPFFFVHGDIDGGGLYCTNLARSLGHQQPFYALTPMGFVGRSQPSSIEGMARCYVRDIRKVQPSGPYLLGGYCNGGVAAFEIARQLQQSGEHVKVLALVRARVGQVRWPGIRRGIHVIFRAIGVDADRETSAFWRIHDHLLRFHRQEPLALRVGRVTELWSNFRARRRSKTTLSAEVAISRQASLAADSFLNIRTRPSMEMRTGNMMLIHVRAMRAYLPGRYDGRVHLFWPEEDRALLGRDNSAGWRRFVRDFAFDEIPGGHVTCVRARHAEWANQLKTILDHAQSTVGSYHRRVSREIA